MDSYFSAAEQAEKWGVTARRITELCQKGAIPGAVKAGKSWRIPSDSRRPAEMSRAGRMSGSKAAGKRLPLPLGIADYKKTVTQYYYVDKTLLIRDFLDERPMVSLFTRPRRFGKTLNMDMLRVFFEKTEEDTSVYFRDRKIWRCGRVYQREQGRYPVIFLTFKDVKFQTWEETLTKIKDLLAMEFIRHANLAESSACNELDRIYYHRLIRKEVDPTELTGALQVLTRMLHDDAGISPVVIIDEYDTPIQQGHLKGFYDDIVPFMRNLFSGGLKDNPCLSYGFLTGILRVAQESLFSGMNNLAVNSVLDEPYSAYFGFTRDEIREMTAYYGVEDRFEEICAWYDGYQFGRQEVINPWSVIHYFRNNCVPAAYWQSTGSNEIIGEVLARAGDTIQRELADLLQGKSVLASLDSGVAYPQIGRNPRLIYSLLLMAGYLKADRTEMGVSGNLIGELSIPNREIMIVYQREILDQLSDLVPPVSATEIQEALSAGKTEQLQHGLERLLMESASTWDTAGESFYHGLVLGLCAVMGKAYRITSNRESGTGRYDLQLAPREERYPGILIELKAEKKASQISLQKTADEAIAQIQNRQYDTAMRAEGVSGILCYGLVFSGKQAAVQVALL